MQRSTGIILTMCFILGCASAGLAVMPQPATDKISLVETFTRAQLARFDEPSQPPTPALIEALRHDRTLTEGVHAVGFSHDGTRIHSLRGELSSPLTGDLVEACRAFLLAHRDLFATPVSPDRSAVDNDGLRLVRHEAEAGATHIGFAQYLDDLPVARARVDLHVGADRRIHLITGSFLRLRLDPAPTLAGQSATGTTVPLSADAAIAVAQGALGVSSVRQPPTAMRMVSAVDQYPVLQTPASASTSRRGSFDRPGIVIWRVQLPAAQPLGDVRVDIDTTTGAVLDVRNEMAFADMPAGRSTGQGSVYRSNPMRCTPTVEPMLYLASHTLMGAWATVKNDNGPAAVALDDRFVYPPTDTHFDEANVYYHLNRIHDFYAGLGFDRMDRSLRVWVHYGTNLDNAFYSPSEDKIRFGDGYRYNDFAREEAIIYHEYAHAALCRIIKIDFQGESGAIHEGQADYFACSLSNDPVFGEWVTAKAGQPCLRDLSNTLHYPEDCLNEVHDDGRIWGGTLWDLRRALGPAVADRLIHGSHFYLKPDTAWFRDGYQAILAADRTLNGGTNEATITAVFKKRGIATSARGGRSLTGAQLRQMARFAELHGEASVDIAP